MSVIQMTTRAKMETLFKVQGVELRFDSDDASESDVLDFFIDDASTQVHMRVGQRYDVADYRNNDMLILWATWIACYFYSQRGGNPSLFYNRYETILNDLDRIQDGSLALPDVNTRWDMVPSLSNIEHDPRYRDRTLRVDQDTSTGVGGTRPQELSENPWYTPW